MPNARRRSRSEATTATAFAAALGLLCSCSSESDSTDSASGGAGGVGSGGTGGSNAGTGGTSSPGSADGAAPLGPCDGMGETFTPGMTKTASTGFSVTLDQMEPSPPAVGNNVWTLTLADTAGPIEGASIEAEPFHVTHGHGVPLAPLVREIGGGTYVLDPVILTMPGLWRTRISSLAQPRTDTVYFDFCVE